MQWFVLRSHLFIHVTEVCFIAYVTFNLYESNKLEVFSGSNQQ